MANSKSSPPPESVPLRNLSPPASILSDDFDRLLSEDEAASESSSIDLDFSQNSKPRYPPKDRGRHAWTFLAACWLIEAMLWGFPLAFGIFQSYYTSHPLFAASTSIPTIGTLATGVSYLAMPLTNMMNIRWPRYQRHMCLAGYALCIVGLVGASFATQIWHLIFFQGFLYGFGWVVCYTPFLFMLNGWFEKRRGLSYGILFSASGVSGLVIPLAVGYLLSRFDFRLALRVYAVITILISGPGFFLIKPRIPTSSSATMHKPETYAPHGKADSVLRVLRSPHTTIFAIMIFLQSLAFFLPNVFLPSYALSLSLSPSQASGLLSLVSLSQVAGQITLGYVSDKTSPYYPMTVSALVSASGAIFIWGPAKSWGMLAFFAALWGFWSASYSVLYSSVCGFLTEDQEVSMMVYGIFSAERGVGNILEGPLSAWLVGDKVVMEGAFGLGRFDGLVYFTGVCMFLACLGGFGVFVKRGR